MKRTLALVIGILVTGCSAIETAPIVFSSRQSGGIDIRTAGGEGALPGLTIGFYNADFAWVPAVGLGKDGKPTAILAQASGNDEAAKDIASVYGQFDGKLFANFAGNERAKQGLGKVFAVGVAAQHVTERHADKSRNDCMQSAVELVNLAIKDANLASKKPSMVAALQAKCSGRPADK